MLEVDEEMCKINGIHIIDFGLAKHVGQKYRKAQNNKNWYAPELYEDTEVTPACDVYSTGMLM